MHSVDDGGAHDGHRERAASCQEFSIRVSIFQASAPMVKISSPLESVLAVLAYLLLPAFHISIFSWTVPAAAAVVGRLDTKAC